MKVEMIFLSKNKSITFDKVRDSKLYYIKNLYSLCKISYTKSLQTPEQAF